MPDQPVYLKWQRAIVNAADMAISVDQDKIFGMQELIRCFGETALVFSKVGFARDVVNRIVVSGEQPPGAPIDMISGSIEAEYGNTVF